MYRCTCIINLVSWCRLRRRRNEIIFFFSCLQLDALRSLKMNSTMNIVDNYRPVQNLGSRKVKSSFSSTQAPPTTTAVPVPPKLQALLSKYPMSFWCWCSSWEKFSSTEWSARPGSLPKGAGGNNAGLSVQFGGCAGWSRKRLCYTRLHIQQHFCNSIPARLYFPVLLPLSIQLLGAAYFVNSV